MYSEFFKILNTQGVDFAVDLFKKIRQKDKDWLPFNEGRMNGLGYQYLQTGKINEALELFKLNVLAFPQSSNVYDSLGEAYLANGDTELAIKNYKKSLELNPDNDNAKQVLIRIEN